MSQPTPREEALRLLGLDPETEPDTREIDRAYHGRVAVYREGALASYALMDESERRERLAQVEAAYKLLSEPEREAFSEALPPTSKPPPYDPASPGASLKRVREHLRLTLDDCAGRTRIMRAHLESLEEERWESLPPAAYVRGFALQYAKSLGITEAEALANELVARSKTAD
ncbi:MAG: helix-turn-helix transcriptional regulator [Deltaproteobacteria bacterium]|nr:helix-turn-helix transcriptional regulator [Deltaproteobacteria bacterium]